MVEIKKNMNFMKRYIYKTVLFVLALGAFAACDSDPVMFDSSNSFVAFEKKSATVKEDATSELQIPVVIAAVPGSQSVTVDFEVDLEADSANITATEGEDFEITNESQSLTFSDGFGTQYISVSPIDNDVFTGTQRFTLKLTSNSADYPFGDVSETVVAIEDDEHPLKLVLGDYVFSGVDAWGDDFSTSITTSPVEGDLTQIAFPLNQLIPGWGAPEDAMVYATVDLEAMEIYIEAGQSYDSFGYGACKISGYAGDEGDPQLEDGELITGTVDEDGNITMEDWIGVMITEGDNEGLSFAIYTAGSVWTKQ